MNSKFLYLFFLLVFFVSCMALPLKKNTYYTERELLMIEKSTQALGMGFGFDSRLDINYFFLNKKGQFTDTSPQSPHKKDNSSSKKETSKKEDSGETDKGLSDSVKKYAEALKGFSDKEQYYFYIKIYYLYASQTHLKKYFKKYKKWREYNIIRIELYPGVDQYMKITNAYFQQYKSQLYQDLVIQQEDIKRDAILFNQKKYTIVDEY